PVVAGRVLVYVLAMAGNYLIDHQLQNPSEAQIHGTNSVPWLPLRRQASSTDITHPQKPDAEPRPRGSGQAFRKELNARRTAPDLRSSLRHQAAQAVACYGSVCQTSWLP